MRALVLASGRIDLDRRRFHRADGTIHRLTPRETALLAYLAKRVNETVTLETLLREVWGYHENVVTRAVDACVHRLRQKIEVDPTTPQYLQTVFGHGFMLILANPREAIETGKTEDMRPEPADEPRSNVDRSMDAFIGRAPELSTLQEHLVTGTARLVSIVGTGGAGKTRLSQHFAHLHLGDFPGGTWFCDLSESRTVEDIAGAVGRALAVTDAEGAAIEQVGAEIRERGSVLIILDNFEHAVEAGAVAVGTWLQDAPDARFLVTSRRRLAIAGEQLIPLESLPSDAAIALFLDRARRIRPDFAEDDAHPGTVEAIVDGLDRIPLAIELAAARIRSLTADGVRQRLDQRFDLLRSPRRDRPDRQRTLSAAIDWSWQLLEPCEQRALAQCSVFRGGFTLEAAEAVLDLSHFEDAPWPLDVVESLVEHSLIRVTEPKVGYERYQIYESIRCFAADRLDETGVIGDGPTPDRTGSDAALPAQRRHAAHYAAWGSPSSFEALYTRTDHDWKMEMEFDNLMAGVSRALHAGLGQTAAECALAALYVLRRTGPVELGLRVFARLLDSPDTSDIDNGTLGQLLLHRSRFLRRQGRLDDASQDAHAALDNARAEGERDRECRSLAQLGLLAMLKGDMEAALIHHTEALQIAQELGSRIRASATHIDLGRVYACMEKLDDAESHYAHALSIAREVGSRRLEGIVLGNMGDVLLDQGKLTSAQTHLQEAIVICDEICPPPAAAFRGSLALVRARQGAFDEARALLQSAQPVLRCFGPELIVFLCQRGEVAHLAGDGEGVRAALMDATSLCEAGTYGAGSEQRLAIDALTALLNEPSDPT